VSVMEEMEDEEQLPYISGSGEGLMEEGPALHAGSRRNEDIALDLMKFVAMTTGYGRTTSSGVGFQGTGSASKPDEYAAQLLELYGKCLSDGRKKKEMRKGTGAPVPEHNVNCAAHSSYSSCSSCSATDDASGGICGGVLVIALAARAV
jgi:hypothetical protein